MKKEIEVKINLEEGEKNNLFRILKKDFRGVFRPGFYQKTYQFFTNDFPSQKVFPRIRNESNKTTTLTVKVKDDKESKYFERKEYTVGISNIPETSEILKSFGFKKMIVWEKIRYDCHVPRLTVELSFDKTPMGWFLEIEGYKRDIEKTLKLLNLDKRPRIARAYLGLWEDYRKEHGLKEHNMLFKK